jgi:predicted transcriptional regulator
MDEEDVNQVPVIEKGHLLGVIARDNLLHYLRLRGELGV